MFRKPILNTLTVWSASILSTIGACAFLFGFVYPSVARQNPKWLSHRQFPLSDPVDVISNSDGHIFVADAFYKRVQVYDENGNFTHGFPYDARGGPIVLDFDETERLRVVMLRGNIEDVFDTSGKHVETLPDTNGERYKALKNSSKRHVDNQRRELLIKDGFISPRIVRTNRMSRNDLEVTNPPALVALSGPWRCWLIAMFGGALHWNVKRQKKLAKIDAELNPAS